MGGRRRSRWGEGDGSQVHRQRRGGERCCFPEVLPPGARLAGADTSLLALRWLRGGIFLKPFTYIQVKTAANERRRGRAGGRPHLLARCETKAQFLSSFAFMPGRIFPSSSRNRAPSKRGLWGSEGPGAYTIPRTVSIEPSFWGLMSDLPPPLAPSTHTFFCGSRRGHQVRFVSLTYFSVASQKIAIIP